MDLGVTVRTWLLSRPVASQEPPCRREAIRLKMNTQLSNDGRAGATEGPAATPTASKLACAIISINYGSHLVRLCGRDLGCAHMRSAVVPSALSSLSRVRSRPYSRICLLGVVPREVVNAGCGSLAAEARVWAVVIVVMQPVAVCR